MASLIVSASEIKYTVVGVDIHELEYIMQAVQVSNEHNKYIYGFGRNKKFCDPRNPDRDGQSWIESIIQQYDHPYVVVLITQPCSVYAVLEDLLGPEALDEQNNDYDVWKNEDYCIAVITG